ncbi:hypothetical protein G7007_19410 [Pseudomonas entomophila]|uniref:hypothetical protein n=1 Tax=Pseudomonas entomophila TaxID=312306 RepID=UPI0015E34BCA|nr:hypothetical protein [Pseudomonas entomophila]MBA1194997.1 hypothetical protein [Pseudomonas entomophila]
MTDTQKIAALEKQVASLTANVASLNDRLSAEVRQRASDDAALAQHISALEAKR